jgi:hypothetical protein
VKTHLFERARKFNFGCIHRDQTLENLVLGECLLVWVGGATVLEGTVTAAVALYAVRAIETTVGAVVVAAWAAVIAVETWATTTVITVESRTATTVFAWRPILTTVIATTASIAIASRTVIAVETWATSAVVTVKGWTVTTVIAVEPWATTAVITVESRTATTVFAWRPILTTVIATTASIAIASRTVITVVGRAVTTVVTVETWATTTVVTVESRTASTVIAIETSRTLACWLGVATVARRAVVVTTLLAWGFLLSLEKGLTLVRATATAVFADLELGLGCVATAGRSTGLAVTWFAARRACRTVAKIRHIGISSLVM